MIYFQWVNGPKIGKIVKYKGTEIDDGELYLKFDDGSRCNREFIALLNDTIIADKQLVHISSPENAWNIYIDDIPPIEERYELDTDGVSHCVQPYVPGKKVKRTTPPKFYHVDKIMTFDTVDIVEDDNIKPMDIKVAHSPKPQEEKHDNTLSPQLPHEPIKQKPLNDNPVYLLCEKSKKVSCEMDTTIEILVPSKSLYDVAKDSFEDGDKHFINYVMDNLDLSKIKEQIKQTLEELYK